MTRKEQLTLLFLGVSLLLGAVLYYQASGAKGDSTPLASVVAKTTLPGEAAVHQSLPTENPATSVPVPREAAPVVLPEVAVQPEAAFAAPSAPSTAAVAIMGAVGREGLYRVSLDTRVGELIDKAGGATEEADLSDINLGARVIDGTTLTIPERPGTRAPDGSVRLRNITPQVINPPAYTRSQSAYLSGAPAAASAPGGAKSAMPSTPARSTGGLINLNTATQAELETLPGIGPAYAQRIIEYRTHTAFQQVDDLDAVPGIGAKRLEQLRPLVTVE